LTRTVAGVVQYYTSKTVAIGQELLVFYGVDYFKEMGYDITRDDDDNTTGRVLSRTQIILYIMKHGKVPNSE